MKEDIRLIGINFDKKLNWKIRINEFGVKCHINNMLIGVLLRTYNSLTLLKMRYGSQIYSAVCKTRLKVLEKVHCAGLRLAIGACRTSPLFNLLQVWNTSTEFKTTANE